jgi:hypothetical protein
MFRSTNFRSARAVIATALLSVAIPAALMPIQAMAFQKKEKPAKAPKLNPAFAKPISEAQKLLQAQKFQEALTQLAAAEAAQPIRSPYEEYVLRETQVQAYNSLKDFPNLGKAIEASLATGQMPADQVPARQRIVGQLALQSKDWPKAIQFLSAYTAANPADLESRYALAQGYYFAKDPANTKATISSLIGSAKAAGQPIKEEWLQLPLRLAVESQNRATVITALTDIVTIVPKPAYWRDLLNQVQAQKLSDRANLNLIRLKDATNVGMDGNDYLEVAEVALRLGLPGEARTYLQRGMTTNAFASNSKKYATDALTQASSQAATDEKSLPASEKSTAAAKLGQPDVAVGLGYLSYNNTAKAIELLERGIAKGGVRDLEDAQLNLGIAKFRAGDSAGALAALGNVKANPQLAQIANLWQIHIKSKAAPAQ